MDKYDLQNLKKKKDALKNTSLLALLIFEIDFKIKKSGLKNVCEFLVWKCGEFLTFNFGTNQ